MIEEVVREPFTMQRVEPKEKMTREQAAERARSFVGKPEAGSSNTFNPEVDNVYAPPAAIDFHNARDPQRTIKHERPEHRMILFMKAQLMSNKEIARELDLTETTVSQVTRQPWFRHALAQRMEDAGGDIIYKTLHGAALDCVYNLIDIANGKVEGTKVSDMRAANDSLLDRFLGKATQRIEQFDGGKVPTKEELDTLDRQLEETRREVARLSGEPQTKPATQVAQ